MAVFEIDAPAGITETDAGRVQSFLQNQGAIVEWVAVRYHEDMSIYYAIEATTDPTAIITNYVRPVTREDTARIQLAQIFPKLLDDTATATEVRRAVAALAVLFKENFNT